MRNERYELQVESDVMVFEFTSVVPKGAIPKLVIYTETNVENIFNLGFGDKDLETDDIDDLIITDNKDSKKVLATVASTVYAFTYKYARERFQTRHILSSTSSDVTDLFI